MAAAPRYNYTPVPYPEAGSPNVGDSVELVFDLFSPRPHFVVRHTSNNVNSTATSSQIDETISLVTRFLGKRERYAVNAILSFHRGSWYQEHGTPWHCHLCVPWDEYYREAKNTPRLGQTYVDSMGKKLVNGKKKYKQYRDTTVSKANRLKSISFNLGSYERNGFRLIWTSPQPRIGIYSQQPQNLRVLYDFMVNLENTMKNDLTKVDSSLSNFGCHFCLFVSGSSGGYTTIRQCSVLNETGTNETVQGLVGYIQMDDQLYYRLLPVNQHKNNWITAFANAEFYVET